MALATQPAGGGMPMMHAASMPVMTMPTATMPNAGGGGGAAQPAGPTAPSGSDLLFTPDMDDASADEIAIGIDLGGEWVRASVWDAEQGRPVEIDLGGDGEGGEPLPLRAVVTFVRPSSTTIGEAALAAGGPEHRLVGIKRLLGRRFDHAPSAAWLDSEAGGGLVACALVDEGGAAKLSLTHKRVNAGLRKRGEAPRVVDEAAPRSATIEKRVAPEEALMRLVAHVKVRAAAALGAEPTHAVLTVPAHWGLGARQAMADAAMLGGLSVLGVVSAAAALCALPRLRPPPPAAAAKGAKGAKGAPAAPPALVLVDWGASSCACAVARFDGGGWRLVASAGDDALGGLALDGALAARLAAQLGADAPADAPANRLALLAAARQLKHALGAGGAGGGGGEGEGEGEGEGAARCEARVCDAAGGEVAAPAALRLGRAEYEAVCGAAACEARLEALLAALAAQAGPLGAGAALHAGGGQLRAPALRALVERLAAARLGAAPARAPPDAAEAAHGAAVLAAHAVQPAAVGVALAAEDGAPWLPPADALPRAVALELDGARRAVFAPLGAPPLEAELSVAAAAEPRTARLVELDADADADAAAGGGGGGGAGGGATVLSFELEALPRRELARRRRETGAPAEQRVRVSVGGSGLLDAEPEEAEPAKPGGGWCGQALLLLLLLAGLAGFGATLLEQKPA